VLQVGDGGTKLQFTGTYDDELRRVDGRWRFARRTFRFDA